MRNFFLILTFCFCFCVYGTQAQVTNAETKTTQAAARVTDTTKRLIPKKVKTRIIGGGQMSSANDVVENIAKSKDHTTFTNSITVAGLAETLKSRGPLTVFAATNDAFKKLALGMLDTLLKPEHNAELTKLLTYNILPGKFTSKDIARQIAASKGEATFTTLAGSKLRAKINGDRNIVLMDDSGNESIISQFDIEQNNGIIDVVTTLLVPKNNL